MRIVSLTTRNIGGLADGRTSLPNAPVLALAGPNGSGKSKFLASLTMPWTRNIPLAADSRRESYVEVALEFTDLEMVKQGEYARQKGIQGEIAVQRTFRIRVVRTPLGGLNTQTDPYVSNWIAEMLQSTEVLQEVPSMNLFFLPAERRISNTGQPFTLMSITPEDNARSIAASRHGQDGAVLEDYEFENYARTLCVAAYLPNAQGELNASAQSDWSRFLEGVNGVLSPKVLLPLTQEEPGNLRVLLPDGNIHGLAGLSSGERQAMIIISRIFRAGEGHTSVAIDEPDAYLHPSLSTRLLRALRLGMPAGAGLILATHSPAILDSIEPSHILRFRHGSLPSPVLTEDDRLELYRSAGFRASAITQSELLVVTEGELDGQVMRDLIPEMSAVSVHAAGGRDLVLRDVAALSGFSLPIIGVVDGDLLANRPSEEIAQLVHVWPTADIEGALLSDAGFLAAALEARLFRPEVTSVEVLQDTLDQILRSFEAETIAEYAMRRLRAGADLHWPSPKDPHAETKVRALGQSYYALEAESIDRAFAAAQTAWSDAETSRWTLVRGKYVLRRLVSEHSIVEGADAFVRAALAGHPTIAAIEPLRRKVTDLLGSI